MSCQGEDDPLAPAKGIALGVVLGACMWAVIIGAIWWAWVVL